MKNEFFIQYSMMSQGWEIAVSERKLDGNTLSSVRGVAKPLEFVEHEPGQRAEPTMFLSHEDMQNFMDAMWRAGVRPQGQTESDMCHMKLHLEDMRKLVFETHGE